MRAVGYMGSTTFFVIPLLLSIRLGDAPDDSLTAWMNVNVFDADRLFAPRRSLASASTGTVKVCSILVAIVLKCCIASGVVACFARTIISIA